MEPSGGASGSLERRSRSILPTALLPMLFPKVNSSRTKHHGEDDTILLMSSLPSTSFWLSTDGTLFFCSEYEQNIWTRHILLEHDCYLREIFSSSLCARLFCNIWCHHELYYYKYDQILKGSALIFSSSHSIFAWICTVYMDATRDFPWKVRDSDLLTDSNDNFSHLVTKIEQMPLLYSIWQQS